MKVQIHIIMASVLIIYGKDPNFNTFLTPTTMVIGKADSDLFLRKLKEKKQSVFHKHIPIHVSSLI